MKKPITLSIEDTLKEQLKTAADDEKRSLSNMAEILIEEALAARQAAKERETPTGDTSSILTQGVMHDAFASFDGTTRAIDEIQEG